MGTFTTPVAASVADRLSNIQLATQAALQNQQAVAAAPWLPQFLQALQANIRGGLDVQDQLALFGQRDLNPLRLGPLVRAPGGGYYRQDLGLVNFLNDPAIGYQDRVLLGALLNASNPAMEVQGMGVQEVSPQQFFSANNPGGVSGGINPFITEMFKQFNQFGVLKSPEFKPPIVSTEPGRPVSPLGGSASATFNNQPPPEQKILNVFKRSKRFFGGF